MPIRPVSASGVISSVTTREQPCSPVREQHYESTFGGEVRMKARRILLVTCCLCLAVSTLLSQDVLTVTGGKETHKVLLDNAHVRVLDVHIPPGQNIAMHSHPANVTYVVSGGKVKVTLPDGKTAVRDLTTGSATWSEPVTHAVENVGNTEIHLVQTEMKETAK
jgi:beta-alanine degradation protein BauB